MIDTSGRFVGAVAAEPLVVPTADSQLAVYAVTFDAGAHTHWHTHPTGQGLYIVRGRAVVHIAGRPPVLLDPGDSIWIDPNQLHWHGAHPADAMTHVAYQEAADDGTTIAWHGPVSESIYTNATEETS